MGFGYIYRKDVNNVANVVMNSIITTLVVSSIILLVSVPLYILLLTSNQVTFFQCILLGRWLISVLSLIVYYIDYDYDNDYYPQSIVLTMLFFVIDLEMTIIRCVCFFGLLILVNSTYNDVNKTIIKRF
jgi:hypothetical protein